MNEAQIIDIAHRLYRQKPQLTHLRTSINAVYVLHFDDLPDKIFKVAYDMRFKEGLLQEQRILLSLSKLGVAVPTLECTQDDMQGVDNWFSIMARDAEFSLADHFKRDNESYSELFRESGRWLAHLHGIDPNDVPGAMSPVAAQIAEIRERRRIREMLDEAELMQHDYHPLFHRFAEIQNRPRKAFIHGDFNATQVMVKNRQVSYVVDWGSGQFGRAMRDLGLCLAYTKFYDYALNEATLVQQGYESVRPLSDAERHECLHWELYTLLRITAAAVLSGADNMVLWGKRLIQGVYMKVI